MLLLETLALSSSTNFRDQTLHSETQDVKQTSSQKDGDPIARIENDENVRGYLGILRAQAQECANPNACVSPQWSEGEDELTCLAGRMIPATGRFRFWRWIKDLHKFILRANGPKSVNFVK